MSGIRPIPALVLAVGVLFVLIGLAASGVPPVAADNGTDLPDTTPIDSTDEDAETAVQGERSAVPSEQVPFGIRTVYGQNDLQRPSGGAGVTVAVLDTGVDRTHPDLRERVTLCRDFTGESVQNTCTDDNGHGTHVAGTVAGDAGPDDRGIYGVAPDAEIHAYKTCDDEGRCSTNSLANAIRAATDRNADVIVMSLGGRTEPRVESATRYATSRGVVVVAAAGNTGPDVGSILYPAAHSSVIGVGAVGPRSGERVEPTNYRVPDFSSRGLDGSFEEADEYLAVAGPGVGVLSPVPGGGYERKSGTSMAAPHIAGLSAKLLGSTNPPNTADDVRLSLRSRAPRFDVTEGRHARAGYDPAAGFGIPTVEAPEPQFDIEPPVPTADQPFTLDAGDSRAPDSSIASYEWDTTGDGSFDQTGERIELTRPAGTYPITLRVRDSDGNTARTTRVVRVNAPPVAAFEIVPSIPTEDTPVTFDGSTSHDPDGEELSFEWDTTGDGSTDTTGEVLETTLGEPGPRTVRLRVTDSDGATDRQSREMLVNDRPEVTVSVPGTVRADERTTLEAVVENEYGETTVTWQFPNGRTVSGERVAYRFDEGDSTVEVTVEDSFGASTTETVLVTAEPRGLPDSGTVVSLLILVIFAMLAGLAVLSSRRE